MGTIMRTIKSLPKSLIFVILIGLLLSVIGVWWGVLPGSPEDWASDTILPNSVMDAASHLFQNGWHTRSPPFHYELLSVLYSPFFALHLLDVIDVRSYPAYTILILLGRALTVSMAVALIVLVYQWARELGTSRLAAVFAAAIATLNPMFAFYSKTTNLDVPYTMWFVASMVLLTRAMKINKLSDYALFVVFATLAICTKDQAYGLYVLIVPVVIYSIFKNASEQTSGLSEARKIAVKKLIVIAATAGAGFGTIYLIPLNLDGVRNHFNLIIGPASSNYRIFANSLLGHLNMLVQSFRQLAFASGWWLLIICSSGLLFILWRKPKVRLILLPLVPIISYYVFFISVVGYNYDRFFLPVIVSLSIFGGIFLSELWYQSRLPRLAVSIFVLAVLAYSFVYAASVHTLMIVDSRYKALAWLESNVGQEDIVSGVGDTYYLPPLTSFKTNHLGRKPSIELVREIDPAYIVVSSIFNGEIFKEGTEPDKFFAILQTGELGYELTFQHQGRPVFNLLNRQNILTNLDKINPEIQIYQKVSER
jgi:hypothetical protein